MARLSRTQEATRQQVLQILGKSLLPEAAASAILTALGGAIASDGGTLYGVDPSSLLLNRTLAASGPGSAERLNWLQNVYLVREPMLEGTFVAQMRMAATAVAFHDRPEDSWGIAPRILTKVSSTDWWRLYHEIGTPCGGILRVCFAADGRWVAAVEIYRLDANRPFRPVDVSFLGLLAPAIGRILGSAFEREWACLARSVGPDCSGVLVLDSHGRPRFCTPAAETWLGLLRGMESVRGESLPTVVSAVVAGLRAVPERYAGRSALIRTPSGELRVEASVGGEDGSVAIVLTPQLPLPPVSLPAHWPLTPQERHIVFLLVGGCTNRQMAAALIISENTVETHLAHIYDKLDARGRVAILARLFQELQLPAAGAIRKGELLR